MTEEIHLTPYNSDKEWIIKQAFLDMYDLLAHRWHTGLDYNSFWEWDTFTTSHFYCTAYNVMKQEEESFKDTSKKKEAPEQSYTISGEDLFVETQV